MKKILVSLLTITLLFTIVSSTTAFADVDSNVDIDSYMIEYLGLPYGVQTEPQTEKELSAEIKEEILQKLLESEYPDADPNDIVIRYYGTLSNGAMLINHYNKTYTYPVYKRDISEYISPSEETGYFNFAYSYSTLKDKVNLYMNGEFYDFIEAYESKLIDNKTLWEIEHSIDSFIWAKISFDSEATNTAIKIKGDVDADGSLTIMDATLVQKKLAGFINFTETEINRADINSDGQVDILDVTQLQKTIASVE
jgi:hypothetical protein